MKNTIFVVVGLLLALNYWLVVVRPRRMQCAPGDVCHVDSRSSRVNRAVYWVSVSIYGGAVVITYAAQAWLRAQA